MSVKESPSKWPVVPICSGERSGGSSAIVPKVSSWKSFRTMLDRQCPQTAKMAIDDGNATGAPHCGQS